MEMGFLIEERGRDEIAHREPTNRRESKTVTSMENLMRKTMSGVEGSRARQFRDSFMKIKSCD